jgi:hypothetical protein
VTEYRNIPGWPGYRATSDGEIQSCRKRVFVNGSKGCHTVLGDTFRTLKSSCNDRGYLELTLNQSGIRKTFRIHVLVAAAFHGPRPEGLHVSHENGDRRDNQPANISYKTPKENVGDDQERHGTRLRGQRCGMTKLTDETVRKVKSLSEPFRDGIVSAKTINQLTGVNYSTVRDILLGRTWTHLQ